MSTMEATRAGLFLRLLVLLLCTTWPNASVSAQDVSPPISKSRCARALAIARRSKCPSSRWKDVIASAIIAGSEDPSSSGDARPLVYVNAGANKGFAVAEFLQRFHNQGGNRTPTNRQWHKSIKRIKPSGMFGCGMCSACKDDPPTFAHNAPVRVLALELLKPNFLLLQKLFAHHAVPGAAYHMAASNYSGIAYAPTGVRTGQEWSGAELGEAEPSAASGGAAAAAPVKGGSGSGGTRRVRSKAWTAVPATTIDALAKREGLERISWLSIDTEGWDALVLEGASGMIERKRVDLLEFEYHSKGLWAADQPPCDRRDLKGALERLSRRGYTCFWQGDRGTLAQATGEGWCDEFEWRGHSNLVCAHGSRIVGRLRSLETQ
jgi:FkbM family methyltransferase